MSVRRTENAKPYTEDQLAEIRSDVENMPGEDHSSGTVARLLATIERALIENKAAREAMAVLRRQEVCTDHWSLHRPECEMCQCAKAFKRKREAAIDAYDRACGIEAVKL